MTSYSDELWQRNHLAKPVYLRNAFTTYTLHTFACILHVTYVSEDAKMSSNVKATKEKA